MNIVKRSGKITDFDIDKIKTSVITASKDINCPLNESDIKIIITDLQNSLKEIRGENGTTSAYEVRGLIYNILLNHGFKNVCKAYMLFTE